MKIVTVASLSLVLALSSAFARADNESGAAKFFSDGSSAFTRKEYSAAALLFEESYRLAPRGPTLYNASLSWERAGNLERGADDLHDAIESGNLPAESVGTARTHLTEVMRQLGVVDVVAPAGVTVTVDGVARRTGSSRAHVRSGPHYVEAVWTDGVHVGKDVSVQSGQSLVVQFEHPQPIEAPKEPIVPHPSSAPLAPPPPTPQKLPHSDPKAPYRTGAWISLGTSVLAVGGAVVFGVVALDAKNSFEPADTNQADHDRAATFRTAANVAWCVAGVAAATGAILLWSPWTPSPSNDVAAFRIGAGPGGISAAGRF